MNRFEKFNFFNTLIVHIRNNGNLCERMHKTLSRVGNTYYIRIERTSCNSVPSHCAWYRWYLIVRNHNTALPSTTFVESRNLQNSPAADGAARMRVMREQKTRAAQRQIQQCASAWILLSIVRRMNKALVPFRNRIKWAATACVYFALALIFILGELIWLCWS